MLKVYFIPPPYNSFDFELELNNIYKYNPDKIICFCLAELDYEAIFGEFFDKAQPWLESKNKIINLITPHLDNVYVRLNIVAEKSYGFISEYMYEVTQNSYYYKPPINQLTPHPVDFNKINKLFTCYNNNYRVERARLVDTLAREDLLDSGIVTFKNPEKYPNWTYHDGSRLFDEEDFTLHSNDYSPNYFPKSFFNTFFDIVPESRYDPGEYHITEKTLKSIMAFKPFITLSSAGYQKEYLEKYIGLKPYDELFDYGFDSDPNIIGRIEGIVNNVKLLNQLSFQKLSELYNQLIPKLVYNKSQIVNLFFNKDRILPTCMKFLIDGTEYEICSINDNAILSTAKRYKWIKE